MSEASKKIDEYLNNISPVQKATYERVRKIVKNVVPDAGEKVSYGILAFTYKGQYLVYFGAFKSHMSLFPASDDMIKAIGKNLDTFRTSKGTLQFTEDKPIPDAVIKDIIQYLYNNIVNSNEP